MVMVMEKEVAKGTQKDAALSVSLSLCMFVCLLLAREGKKERVVVDQVGRDGIFHKPRLS